MPDLSWMDASERAEFERNREELLENALVQYHIGSEVNEVDEIVLTGELSAIVDFYGDYRSEIEEML